MSGGVVRGDSEIAEGFFEKMPVKEVTVFKDGHTFVRHEGPVTMDADGKAVLDYLPRPVVGTFWAYSADDKVALDSVVASRKVVSVKDTALSLRELIEANVGRKVRVREQGGSEFYEAVIRKVPVRERPESERTAPGATEVIDVAGDVVLLEVAEGMRVVPIAQIERMSLTEGYEEEVVRRQYKNVMTLNLRRAKGYEGKSAKVGMVYLQAGIRWIPSYYVDIDGQGRAKVKLQATIINELTDLEDVTAQLVIGVPSFAFKDTVDPISLQQTIAQLSSHFQQTRRNAYAYSNMIMSQAAYPVEPYGQPGGAAADTIDLGPELKSGRKNEDLYVFTVKNLTLGRGERMVVPVVEFELEYRDIFIVDLPFGPPPEAMQDINNEQQMELARLLHAPRAMHNIRFVNTTEYPVTTAPALVLRQGRLIAQGMTKYTAVGSAGDLELTTAVDISVEKSDVETGRTPNAANWGGYTFSRCDMKGGITLTNHKDKAVEIEVKRLVLGNIDSAEAEGKIEHFGLFESGWMGSGEFPVWWHWYRWPYWYNYFNPVGQVKWQTKAEAGEKVDLEYAWHYFWRN